MSTDQHSNVRGDHAGTVPDRNGLPPMRTAPRRGGARTLPGVRRREAAMKPHGWCASDCPRQTSHDPADCTCGGWEREADMRAAYVFRPACHHPAPPMPVLTKETPCPN